MHKKRSRKRVCVCGGGVNHYGQPDLKVSFFSTTFLLSKGQIFSKRLSRIRKVMLGLQLSFFYNGLFSFRHNWASPCLDASKSYDWSQPYTETFSLGLTSSRIGYPGITGSEQKPEKDVLKRAAQNG